jgi:Fe-S-cluster containining protein
MGVIEMQSITNKVSIPKEALCVCGSGKSFGECCISKNHIYESLTISEIGATVIYDQTEIITAVKNLNSFIDARINSTATRLSQTESIRKLKRLYEKFGNALQPISGVVSCKAGCSQCCHLLVLTSQLEAEIIKDYISSHYSPNELSEFKEKIKEHKDLLSNLTVYNNGNFSEESTQAYLSAKIPCAFLDKNHCCSIYEARPFICRKYLVFDNPEICSNPFNKTTQYYSGYHSTVKDAIIKLNQLTYSSDYKYKHLLSWFI